MRRKQRIHSTCCLRACGGHGQAPKSSWSSSEPCLATSVLRSRDVSSDLLCSRSYGPALFDRSSPRSCPAAVAQRWQYQGRNTRPEIRNKHADTAMRVCVSSKILRSKKGGLPDARCPSPPLADPEASKDLSDTTGHTGRPEDTPKMDPLGIEPKTLSMQTIPFIFLLG